MEERIKEVEGLVKSRSRLQGQGMLENDILYFLILYEYNRGGSFVKLEKLFELNFFLKVQEN